MGGWRCQQLAHLTLERNSEVVVAKLSGNQCISLRLHLHEINASKWNSTHTLFRLLFDGKGNENYDSSVLLSCKSGSMIFFYKDTVTAATKL